MSAEQLSFLLGSSLVLGGVALRQIQIAKANDKASKSDSTFLALQKEFNVDKSRLDNLVKEFLTAMNDGLAVEGGSCLRMLPTFVTQLPTGSEVATVHALDLGGTNLRVARVELQGNGEVVVTDSKCRIPQEAMTGTAEGLFDFIAAAIKDSSTGGDGDYGFTFSFPTSKTSLCSGKLIAWTKGFSADGAEGEDIVALLQAALQRAGVQAQLKALVNDTTGTLAAGKYKYPGTLVGVIIGTGTNAAYVERRDAIGKLGCDSAAPGGDMAINMEWGAMGDGSAFNTVLPESSVDAELDAASLNPTQQRFEKMISGMYMGEITRRALVKLIDAGELTLTAAAAAAAADAGVESKEEGAGDAPTTIRTPMSFDTAWMSDIEGDGDDAPTAVDAVLSAAYNCTAATAADRATVKAVCAMVSSRASALVGAAIAAVVTQLGERGPGCTVAIDGSVFQFYPGFKAGMESTLSLLGVDCTLVLAKDGSGKGAALVAAVAGGSAAATAAADEAEAEAEAELQQPEPEAAAAAEGEAAEAAQE